MDFDELQEICESLGIFKVEIASHPGGFWSIWLQGFSRKTMSNPQRTVEEAWVEALAMWEE